MTPALTRLVAVASVAVAVGAIPAAVAAQEGGPDPIEVELEEDGEVDVERYRPVPDYDNRGEAPTTAGDVALWVPRLLVSPLYLVSEFVVRRPLGALVTTAELNDWPAILVDFFTFGPDRHAGIVPIGLIDFGFRPSIGLYFWWDDFLFEGNELRIRGSYGGQGWRTASLRDRIELQEDRTWLSLEVLFEQRPDWVFYGLGPESPNALQSRFEKIEIGGSALFESHVWRSSTAIWEIGVTDVRFGDASCCDDPSVARRVDQGDFPALPPGWSGYTKGFNRLELALDTRLERPAPGDGVRVEVEGEHGFDLDDPVARRWLKYGGNVSGFWDPSGDNRVVSLTLTALFADPLGSASVPFTEQVQLGGLEHMRGYLDGRLVDRSAAVAALEYQWPIWVWLDGRVHAAVGNVFGEHLDGFDPSLLRLSFGIGFETMDSRDNSFGLILAAGSEPFDRFEISSVRFLFGTLRGY